MWLAPAGKCSRAALGSRACCCITVWPPTARARRPGAAGRARAAHLTTRKSLRACVKLVAPLVRQQSTQLQPTAGSMPPGAARRAAAAAATAVLLVLAAVPACVAQQTSPLAGQGQPGNATRDIYMSVYLDRLLSGAQRQLSRRQPAACAPGASVQHPPTP